ncbi:MAG: hypothetical protein ACP5D0_06335 [Hydrogenovibrio sp.]
MFKLTPMFKLRPLVIATSMVTPLFLAGCNSSDSGSSSPSDIAGQVIGSDMVGYLEASNENLIAQYVVIMNNLQAIYQMEYLALYLHANAAKIKDAELSKWYASLEVYEPNITKDNSLSENLTNLNTA